MKGDVYLWFFKSIENECDNLFFKGIEPSIIFIKYPMVGESISAVSTKFGHLSVRVDDSLDSLFKVV